MHVRTQHFRDNPALDAKIKHIGLFFQKKCSFLSERELGIGITLRLVLACRYGLCYDITTKYNQFRALVDVWMIGKYQTLWTIVVKTTGQATLLYLQTKGLVVSASSKTSVVGFPTTPDIHQSSEFIIFCFNFIV